MTSPCPSASTSTCSGPRSSESRSAAASQRDRIGIRLALEMPDNRSPVPRANTKRRSPTAPSTRRSIASGCCRAVDFTVVRLKPATTGIPRILSTLIYRPHGRSAYPDGPRRGARRCKHSPSATTKPNGSRARPSAAPSTPAPRSTRRSARRSGGATGSASVAPRKSPNPGDYIVRDLAGESIFIVRNDDDQLHGFYNVCSHRGHEVPRRRAVLGHRAQGVRLPVPRVGLRPERPADRHAEREGGRAVQPRRLPAARVRGRDLRRLHLREPAPSSRARSPSTSPRARKASRCSIGSSWTSCASACASSMRSPPTGRSSWRTTTSACTARRCTPNSCRSCRCSVSARSGTRRRATTATGCARARPASR